MAQLIRLTLFVDDDADLRNQSVAELLNYITFLDLVFCLPDF